MVKNVVAPLVRHVSELLHLDKFCLLYQSFLNSLTSLKCENIILNLFGNFLLYTNIQVGRNVVAMCLLQLLVFVCFFHFRAYFFLHCSFFAHLVRPSRFVVFFIFRSTSIHLFVCLFI